MPKSTTTHGAAELLVGRDRVDEPVGADLARVVQADRHAGLRARADDRHRRGRGSARHRRPLRPQRGTVEETIDAVEVVEAHAAQREQVAQRGAELVGGRLAHGGEAPVLDELAVAEGAQMGLRVADVDDEEHGRGTLDSRRRGRDPLRHSRLASVRVRGAGAAAQGDRRTGRIDIPPSRTSRSSRGCASAAAPCPALVLDGRESSARGTSCARSTSGARAAAVPGRPEGAQGASSAPRSGARRCSSRSCGASSGPRCGARRRAMPSYSEGARLPVPAPLARLSAPLVARAEQRINGARDLNVRADLAHLDQHLERVERLDRARRDRRRAAERRRPPDRRGPAAAADDRGRGALGGVRPATQLAFKWFPRYGRLQGTLPAAWFR